jgi:peptidyl-prolyl cis-trans isomerase SurA
MAAVWGLGLLAAPGWVVVSGLLATPGLMWAQAPRYQSPFGAAAPAAPSLPTPAAITPNGAVVEDVIVKVNDQIINRSDVERSEEQLQQELQQQNVSPADREQRERDMLRDMIDQQLLLSRGKELGLNADAEVIRRLDEIRKQNHLDSMEALEKAARQQGVSFEDFKANIRNGVITQQVVREEVGRRLQMTQVQEQAFYDAHKAEFEQPEQVRLSEILIPTPADASDATVAQAKAKAEAVEAKVITGGNFDDLAKQNSGGPTAAQGGDLGQFKRGALAKVLEDQTFDLKAGQVTAPIRTKQGFVILKVTEHQDAGVPPMKQVESQIQEAMYTQQMQPALRGYLTKLREEAYIDIKPGFVDSGASARQTKPIFTAYAPPVVKNKKVLQKARFDRTVSRPAPVTATNAAVAPLLPVASAGTRTGVPAAAAAADSSPGVAAPTAAVGSSSAEGVAAGEKADAQTAPSVDGRLSGEKTTKRVSREGGRHKKIRREKVRYGQAPRNALPAGSQDMASGTDVGAGAESAAVTPGGLMAGGAATTGAGSTATPGTAMAPVNGTTEISSTSDADPLTPKVVQTGKTRFSARAPEMKIRKAEVKQAKVQEKNAATPVMASTEETVARQQQSAPLGLNGDTTKKKVKRVKGAPKERLQDKPTVDPAAAAPVISPTVNPALGVNPGGTTTPPADSNRTTLPPVTAPAPGANPTGQPMSPTGTPSTTPNGTSAPPL